MLSSRKKRVDSQDNAGVIVNDKGEMKGSAIQASRISECLAIGDHVCFTEAAEAQPQIAEVPNCSRSNSKTKPAHLSGASGKGMRRAVAEDCLLRQGPDRVFQQRDIPISELRSTGWAELPSLAAEFAQRLHEHFKGVDCSTKKLEYVVRTTHDQVEPYN